MRNRTFFLMLALLVVALMSCKKNEEVKPSTSSNLVIASFELTQQLFGSSEADAQKIVEGDGWVYEKKKSYSSHVTYYYGKTRDFVYMSCEYDVADDKVYCYALFVDSFPLWQEEQLKCDFREFIDYVGPEYEFKSGSRCKFYEFSNDDIDTTDYNYMLENFDELFCEHSVGIEWLDVTAKNDKYPMILLNKDYYPKEDKCFLYFYFIDPTYYDIHKND